MSFFIVCLFALHWCQYYCKFSQLKVFCIWVQKVRQGTSTSTSLLDLRESGGEGRRERRNEEKKYFVFKS